MSKAWHISDTHLSFGPEGQVLKPMHERRWALGAWTYIGYLDRMAEFGTSKIADEDITFITGDIVHDMKQGMLYYSIRWLRNNIRGIIVICRGNHDKYWDVGEMRAIIAGLPNVYLLDEGEILTIGAYTVGCFSNHSEKTQDFNFVDGRYLEMAMAITKQARDKDKIPVMMSHYPMNLAAAEAIGKTGLVAYLSGHIHCTGANESGPDHPLTWDWYNRSAAQTDDKVIEGCFFSTATTDVVQARHKQSFKELTCLEIKPKPMAAKEKKTNDVLVLVGLPGCGKSTVAKILEEKHGYVRVNQDELGSRKACIRLAEEAIRLNKNVVIDRCNFDEGQRSTWVGLARGNHVPSIRVMLFNVSEKVCRQRAKARTDHPTITSSEIADKAISAIGSKLVFPTTNEKFTEEITVGENDTLHQMLFVLGIK